VLSLPAHPPTLKDWSLLRSTIIRCVLSQHACHQTKRSMKFLFEVFCFNAASTLPNLNWDWNPRPGSLESGLSFMKALLMRNDPQYGEKHLSCSLSWSQMVKNTWVEALVDPRSKDEEVVSCASPCPKNPIFWMESRLKKPINASFFIFTWVEYYIFHVPFVGYQVWNPT